MQTTIVRADNTVAVGGVSLPVDCSALSPLIHAVQWNDDAGMGHIEFVQTPGRPHILNVKLVEFGDYEYLRAAWQIRKQEIAVAERAFADAQDAAAKALSESTRGRERIMGALTSASTEQERIEANAKVGKLLAHANAAAGAVTAAAERVQLLRLGV